MKMKSMLPILLGLAAMGYNTDMQGGGNHVEPLTDAELARMRERRKYAEKELLKSKGLKEFEINGKIYLAINYKNALKKSKKAI